MKNVIMVLTISVFLMNQKASKDYETRDNLITIGTTPIGLGVNIVLIKSVSNDTTNVK